MRFALLAALFALLLWTPRAARADDTLTVIGGSNPTAFYEVLDHVAERAGFYKDQHLIVNKQYAGNPSTCVQLVATGKGDICSMAFEPVLLGYERGLRFQFFLSRDPQFQHVLAVLDDSPIKTLADFKGAELGEISLGGAAEMGANSTLAGAGLKKSDYTFIPIGFGAQAIAAITTKKVAAAAFPYPELASYEVVAHLKFRYFWNPILRDIGNVGYAATPATIQAKGDQLRRFSRAIVQAAILTRVNPNLAARYFLEGAGIRVTDESAAETKRACWCSPQANSPASIRTNPKIGYIPPLGMEVYTKFLAANGITSVVVPVSAVVTNQFVDYANDFDRKAFIAQAKAMR